VACDLDASACPPCAAFHALGFLCGLTDSRALGISFDGEVVVGQARAQRYANHVASWQWQAGLMGQLMPGMAISVGQPSQPAGAVNAANDDGSVFVGNQELVIPGADNRPSVESRAFRSRAGARSPEFLLEGQALGVSGDGTVVVGWTPSGATSNRVRQAFRIDSSERVLLDSLLGQGSIAFNVSRDGRWVVGTAVDAAGENTAVRWDRDGTVQSLGTLAGDTFSEAFDASADGSVVVGWSGSSLGARAFRWRQDTGAMESLSPLERAVAVSGDGRRAVGVEGNRAAIWDAETGGVRRLEEVLDGLVPEGWVLEFATGISADGRRVVGYGRSPTSVVEEAWIATLGPRCDPGRISDAGGTLDAGDTPPIDASREARVTREASVGGSASEAR
jgi:uncharacterized membrane protein